MPSSCQEWIFCAGEGDRCECPTNRVRFGVDPFWNEAAIEGGSELCQWYIFGDPAPHQVKQCQCKFEYPCEDIVSIDEEVVFEFDAADFDAFPYSSVASSHSLDSLRWE